MGILVDGRDIMTVDPVELRRGMGYVIQNVGLFPHRTIEENVATVAELVGWPAQRRRERARDLLELVGLDPRARSAIPASTLRRTTSASRGGARVGRRSSGVAHGRAVQRR